MINPKELRIGNYIRYRDEWNCEVESLGYTFATHNKDLSEALYGLRCGSDAVEDYNGIPLTDEWLLKCGYEFNNETFGYVSKNHMIVISLNDDELIFMPFCTNDEDCYLRIRYVHQLQNILFVFGEELNITG